MLWCTSSISYCVRKVTSRPHDALHINDMMFLNVFPHSRIAQKQGSGFLGQSTSIVGNQVTPHLLLQQLPSTHYSLQLAINHHLNWSTYIIMLSSNVYTEEEPFKEEQSLHKNVKIVTKMIVSNCFPKNPKLAISLFPIINVEWTSKSKKGGSRIFTVPWWHEELLSGITKSTIDCSKSAR